MKKASHTSRIDSGEGEAVAASSVVAGNFLPRYSGWLTGAAFRGNGTGCTGSATARPGEDCYKR